MRNEMNLLARSLATAELARSINGPLVCLEKQREEWIDGARRSDILSGCLSKLASIR
jgi:hypothetical protein